MTFQVPHQPGVAPVDEPTFAELIPFVKKQGLWVASFAILGLIAGVIFTFSSHKQWAAESILQVGQIEYPSGPVLTESVPEIVERIKSADVRNELLKAQHEDPSEESSPLFRLLKKSLDATAIPGSSLIRLSVRGFSPDQAQALLQQAQDRMIELSQHDSAPVLEGLRKALAAVNQSLADNQTQLTTVNATLQQHVNGSATSANDAVALGILNRATTERLDLMQQQRSLELQLTRSFVSKPVQAPTVEVAPVFPRPLNFAIAGFAIGVFVGCVVGWIRHMRQARIFA